MQILGSLFGYYKGKWEQTDTQLLILLGFSEQTNFSNKIYSNSLRLLIPNKEQTDTQLLLAWLGEKSYIFTGQDTPKDYKDSCMKEILYLSC